MTGAPRAGRWRAATGWVARHWRGLVSGGAVLGTVAVIAAAAWQVTRAWDAQRAGVRRALRAYTVYVGRLLSEEIVRTSGERRIQLLAPLGVTLRDGRTPITLDALMRHVTAHLDSPAERDDPLRGAFDVPVDVARGGGVAAEPPDVRGALRDSTLRRLVLEAVAHRRLLPSTETEAARAVFFTYRGTPVSAAFAELRDPDGRSARVVGITYDRRLSFARAVGQGMTHVSPLPLTLGGDVAAAEPPARVVVQYDAVRDWTPTGRELAVRARTASGERLYETPGTPATWWTSPYAATIAISSAPGGFTLEVALDPERAGTLVTAAVPASARLVLWGVLALGIVFALAVLRELQRQRALTQARAAFVSAVSHELRTPLAQICLFSETLLDGGADSAEQERRWLRVINREAHRLGVMVENVLLHARGERQETPHAPRRCDLAGVLDDVTALLEPLAAARGMTLDVEAPTPCDACVDPGAVRQMLVNLVDNAIKYGTDGQIVGVRLAAEADDRWVRIAVSDQGPGVAPRDRVRIWRAFERGAHARTPGVEGSGLGLSVVADLVARHGGTVDVHDAPGGGAQFVVRLPRG